MSAIARVLLESAYEVSGSDRTMSPLASSLQASGVRIDIGHRAENVNGAQIVVRSSAIPDDNVEVVAALRQGIPVLKRSEFLPGLMEGCFAIAVAGTHGKTTTTAMIAWMLTYLDQDPSYIAGGVLNNTGANAHAGGGPAFVIEADEYDRMFLGLKPNLAVVTNIEHDHPDCYPSEADFFAAFTEFARGMRQDGILVACSNDPGAARLAELVRGRGQNVVTYAVIEQGDVLPAAQADYLAQLLPANSHGTSGFKVSCTLQGAAFQLEQTVRLQLPGKHNIQNALAALAVAHQMHLPVDQAARALAEFRGTGRRFEVRGQVGGITVIDDYAHHPTEIRATIAAARERYPHSGLWVVWQPHTYSRTRLLLDDFATAFEQADQVVVTNIYAAREQPPEDGFSSQDVAPAIAHPQARHIPSFTEVITYLEEHMQPGDVLLVLSAGDADQVSAGLLALLRERSDRYD